MGQSKIAQATMKIETMKQGLGGVQRCRAVPRVVLARASKRASRDEKKAQEAPGGVVAQKALVAALCGILLTSTALPEESLAARSGGRVGGRAFRSAPRPRASPRASPRMGSSRMGGTTYVAPPLVGGHGGYGFNSFFAPPIFFFSPFGSIFQIFLLFVAVQAVLSFGESFRTKGGFKDDDDDEDIFD